MRVGIVGLGLMGGSLALALRAARPDLEVVGRDPDPATIRRAGELGIVEGGDLRQADVVVLAAPIPALRGLLVELAGHPGIVTDVASTKSEVMRWAAEAGVNLVGGHPMCGRELHGIDAADPAIFLGAPWALTRDDPVVAGLVRAIGAIPVVMSAERHDHLVAGVSHAAFSLATAFVLALARDPDWPAMARVAGPGFRDVSRLAAGDPDLYAAIASTNRAPLAAALRAVEASLADLRCRIESGDEDVVELFRRAERVRQAWARGETL